MPRQCSESFLNKYIRAAKCYYGHQKEAYSKHDAKSRLTTRFRAQVTIIPISLVHDPVVWILATN